MLRDSKRFVFPTEEQIMESLIPDVLRSSCSDYIKLRASIVRLTESSLMNFVLSDNIRLINMIGDYLFERKKQYAFFFYYFTYRRGDSHGLYGASQCYLHGIGVSKNTIKAIDLLEQSSKDFEKAQLAIAYYYSIGGIKVDDKIVYRLNPPSFEDKQDIICVLENIANTSKNKVFVEEAHSLLQRYRRND